MKSIGVGCDDQTMVPGLQSQEELVRKGDRFVQPCLGDHEVDEQVFRWLEVLAAPGETIRLEERLGSADQWMPDRKLPPYRALTRRPLVGRPREGPGPFRQGSVPRPRQRVARTQLGEWRLLRRSTDRQLRPITALRPRYVEQRTDAGHVARRDAEPGCHRGASARTRPSRIRPLD